jgi:hypothetical protein
MRIPKIILEDYKKKAKATGMHYQTLINYDLADVFYQRLLREKREGNDERS